LANDEHSERLARLTKLLDYGSQLQPRVWAQLVRSARHRFDDVTREKAGLRRR
jgi:hypothetical protein